MPILGRDAARGRDRLLECDDRGLTSAAAYVIRRQDNLDSRLDSVWLEVGRAINEGRFCEIDMPLSVSHSECFGESCSTTVAEERRGSGDSFTYRRGCSLMGIQLRRLSIRASQEEFAGCACIRRRLGVRHTLEAIIIVVLCPAYHSRRAAPKRSSKPSSVLLNMRRRGHCPSPSSRSTRRAQQRK